MTRSLVRARHLILFVGVLATSVSCRANRPTLAVYPWSGFGRLGCFAGPGLKRGYSPSDSSPPRTAPGPWLVLDSISAEESARAGEGALPPEYLRRATFLVRFDTLTRVSGVWHRPSADSVIVEETTLYPPVTWRFARRPDGLEGEGVLVSDVIKVINGERRAPSVSRWPVRVRRVACTELPVIEW